jgi:hypothetical protein
MPSPGWTPSIVPTSDVYLVVDDFDRNGRAYREADVETTDLETVIADLLDGKYQSPVTIVSFNTAEKWSLDVSAEVAHELRNRCDLQMREVPFFLQDFVDRYDGRRPDYHYVQLTLPLRLVCDSWLPARPAPKRPTPASSNRHSQRPSTRCHRASAGCTKSNSTVIVCSFISLTRSLRPALTLDTS